MNNNDNRIKYNKMVILYSNRRCEPMKFNSKNNNHYTTLSRIYNVNDYYI